MSDDPNETNEANSINESDDDQTLLPFDDGSMGRLIRRQWHEGRWYFSVVDVIAVLTDSEAPRQYWGTLKKRLQDEGASEPLTKCLQLKMRATDAADAETMLRIVQSIPSIIRL